MLNKFFIQTVQAQTDGNAHPTIPFIPPGGPTPTLSPSVSPTPINTGPIINLTSTKNIYNVGEAGIIEVKIDTKGVEVSEFTIIIEFDPTHIQINDDDISRAGVQVKYLDSYFIPTTDGNKVETNISSNQSGVNGRITIKARALEDPITISDRSMAQINFVVISAKSSNLVVNSNESNLLSNSVNELDSSALRPLQVNSSTDQVPTVFPSGFVTPTPSSLIETALDGRLESVLILSAGVILVAIGVYLRKATSKKNV